MPENLHQQTSAKSGDHSGSPISPLSQPPTLISQSPPHIADHELLRRIGSGSYGEVWLARNVLGEFRAVKVVYRDRFEHQRPYEREFDGIRKFEPISRLHDSQVDILHVGRNAEAGFFYYARRERRGPRAKGSRERRGQSRLLYSLLLTPSARQSAG